MNDRIKESLSALVDGETDELEVRRVLNELDKDSELKDTWKRYQLMGSLMREESVSPAQLEGVDLSKGIMQAIEGEPMDEVPARQGETSHSAQAVTPRRFNWLASGAVAASVTLAVLLGVRLNSDIQQQELVADAQAPVVENQQVASAPDMTPEQLEQAQRKLQEYVLQHTENAALNTGRGMMPFARVASFEENGAQAEAEQSLQQSSQRQSTEQQHNQSAEEIQE
ncbi:sigma-E factor negative regulatory protein [Bacterioplanoides sp. SCSIO 12839]|uniref:sigma-E factor negative regulatory protein n=1 Tax=Bacterioplanoides sp. SCSIO 12839 TaxID=2829569 RepID=UPI0021067B68|nr:RseA family anti-sigma factor [Bacterioplanoides sp. SCSIO 12839]UTW47253.1 hypothetical protein KFF03_11730 [Bacterioplanoides sp. SCSIO 12839]